MLGVAAHSWDPQMHSEAKAGSAQVQGQPELIRQNVSEKKVCRAQAAVRLRAVCARPPYSVSTASKAAGAAGGEKVQRDRELGSFPSLLFSTGEGAWGLLWAASPPQPRPAGDTVAAGHAARQWTVCLLRTQPWVQTLALPKKRRGTSGYVKTHTCLPA